MSEAEYSGEPLTQETSRQHDNPMVQQIFSMFKSYLEDKVEVKGKQIEQRGKTEKEVVQLNYKGNKKQYEMNATIEGILNDISRENDPDKNKKSTDHHLDKQSEGVNPPTTEAD